MQLFCSDREDFDKAIEACLTTTWAGCPLYFYEQTDSTNLRAKQEAENGAPQGTLIVADMQTAGRGRSGRTWNSPAGTNLYFSLILRPKYEIAKASMMTLVMALAVAGGMEAVCRKSYAGVASDAAVKATSDVATKGMMSPVTEDIADAGIPEISIKWPNDIVINGKKVCGILTELCVEQGRIKYAVIGVGVNVGRQEFPPELADTATSVECELASLRTKREGDLPSVEAGDEPEENTLLAQKAAQKPESAPRQQALNTLRADLLNHILQAFEEKYEAFCRGDDFSELMEEYNGLLVNCGREVRVLDPKGEYTGLCKGINEKGELLVELPDGRAEAVYAGEVSVRGIYGYV